MLRGPDLQTWPRVSGCWPRLSSLQLSSSRGPGLPRVWATWAAAQSAGIWLRYIIRVCTYNLQQLNFEELVLNKLKVLVVKLYFSASIIPHFSHIQTSLTSLGGSFHSMEEKFQYFCQLSSFPPSLYLVELKSFQGIEDIAVRGIRMRWYHQMFVLVWEER